MSDAAIQALHDASAAMEGGYALWVGAGLTFQIAADHQRVPLWGELTQALEERARIKPVAHQDYPARLQACSEQLGAQVFLAELRRRYYTELCIDLLEQLDGRIDGDDPLPPAWRAVAALGQMALRIVNFNIEPLSSVLLARPAGPISVSSALLAPRPRIVFNEATHRPKREVVHPHGLATETPVMTAAEYASNQPSLAFSAAIQAAFRKPLAIVGMSLDDQYLKDQIERYRSDIGEVLWFNERWPDGTKDWAQRHDVRVVDVPWARFWALWPALHGDQVEEAGLLAAAWLAASLAAEEAAGGSAHGLVEQLQRKPTEGTAALVAALGSASAASGEPRTRRTVNGKAPQAIVTRLEEHLRRAGIAQRPELQWHTR